MTAVPPGWYGYRDGMQSLVSHTFDQDQSELGKQSGYVYTLADSMLPSTGPSNCPTLVTASPL